ncbi:MAG: hypothetical protein RIR01_1908 [Bacteroidota bacterium]|jgi:hypothetical protein
MAKKETLNPIALRYGVTPKEENEEEENPIARDIRLGVIGGSKPEKIETPSYKELEDISRQSIQNAENLRKELDQYEGLNEQEKKYLIDKNIKGELKGADFSQTLFTMAGLMPEQKKILTKDAKGNKIYADEKDMFDIFEEQKKDFNYDKLVSDLTSKIQASGKNSYYMKDKGDGTLIAFPLAINEKPEAKDVKSAQVFSSLDDDAIGDSRFADIAKKAYNIIPSVAQGFISIPETVQGLVTGKTGGTYKLLKSALEEGKFKTTQEYQKGILDTEKIDEFSDFLSKDVYDLSGDKILNTVVNVASSLGEFALTRKMIPLKGKAGTFAAGIAMNIKEPLQAAEDAGVEGRGKYAVAATYALAASAIETLIGIEGKIFDDAATTAKKEMINKIIKDNVEVVGGKLTKESVENLYKETLKEIPSFYAKYAKNTIGEVTEEVAQNMIQNGAQEIHDIVMKDDPESAKYNTKFWSPEALAEYINSAAGGLIGGMGGSLFIKNKQSQTAYDAIKDGKENELKVQLTSGLKEGRLTKDDYDRAIFKINSYKEYYEATKDRPVTDEERRKIFDLTYEKENIKSGIENLKQNNPGGIQDQLIATKEQELSDYNQQIKDIWSNAEARTSTSPVEEAKVEVPIWKTKLETFRKNTGNADKLDSKNLTTREQINSSIGVTPELNRVTESFSIDFKAPHLPEGSGIQIRKGVLYEPYTVKKEGEEDKTETRELPVYAMQDKDGGTWLFATGEKTDTGAPDVSYLIKLNEEGGYEGHQEFKYETAKKNELNFDNIVQAFNELGIEAATLSDEIKGLGLVPEAEFEEEVEEDEEIPEEKEIVESELFKQTYETVKSGVNKAKLKVLSNNTVGVTINGVDVPFASQSLLNKEDLPSGDVDVNVRAVENVKDSKGKNVGRGVIVETQEGIPLGYIRRAGKAQGTIAVEKISETEDIDVDVPVELSDVAKEKLQQIEKNQSDYELVEDELGRGYVNKKTGERYTSVSTFVSGRSGGDFGKNRENLKRTAFGVGNIINGIVKDFFNGTIKAYSNYAENISRDDYNDIIRQLQKVNQYAKEKGYSIITKPLIIADDVNKIAGQPNLIMVDENGKFYVYDVATLRNTSGVETKELLNKRYENKPTNAERISAQVNILADILNNKYGIEVGKVGVIPFNVDYEVAKKGQPIRIEHAVRSKRVDFKRKQILKPTGKTSAEQVQEKVAEAKPAEVKPKEVKEKPVKKKAEKKPKEVKFKEATELQKSINSILSMVSEYNSLKKGRLGKGKPEGQMLKMRINQAVNELNNENVRVRDTGNGIKIVNQRNKPYRFVSYEYRNRGKAKDYIPLEQRDKIVIDLFDKLNNAGLWVWPKIMGADGKRMSNKQLSASINDVAQNIPSNGANALLKQLETIVSEGYIEAEYAGKKSNFIPLDLFLESLKEVDEGQFLEEDAKAFKEIYEEFPVTEEMISESEMAKAAILEQEIEEAAGEKEYEIEEGKDIVREEGDEEYPFQKAKSVKSIFDEAVKLFYKIRGTEGASKKRNLTQERKDLLKENPSVKFIDNNISSIFEQLEKKGIIKRKGNCP